MWVHLGLLDLLDRRWVFPHMKHPVPTEQVGSATPEISFNDPYTLQHASLAQHHNTNFLQTPFSVQFYPLRNNHNPLRPVSHLASSLFWKTSVCTQVRRLLWKLLCSFMASKLEANTNRKAACTEKTTSGCESGYNWKIALKHAKWQGTPLWLYIILTHRQWTRIDTPSY